MGTEGCTQNHSLIILLYIIQKNAFSSCQQSQHRLRELHAAGEQRPSPSAEHMQRASQQRHPWKRQLQHLSSLCSHSPLPLSFLHTPHHLLCFLAALCVEALCAERGVCLLYPVLQCSALDGGIFILCLRHKGLQAEPCNVQYDNCLLCRQET